MSSRRRSRSLEAAEIRKMYSSPSDKLQNEEPESKIKRASSLTKLSQSLSLILSRTSSAKKSQNKQPLFRLEKCNIITIKYENTESQQTNAACIMIQESEDEVQAIRNATQKIYSFEVKQDTKKIPNTSTLPVGVEPKEPQSEVSIKITSIEKFCRFCFESDEEKDKGKLISPCRCDGSLKHIHEGCLRTWILLGISDNSSIINAKCEICSYTYHLEAKKKAQINCCRAFNHGLRNLIASLGLAICLGNLIWLASIYLQYNTGNQQDSNQQNQGQDIILLIGCVFLTLTLLIFLIVCLKKAFFEVRFVALKIHDFDPKSKENIFQPADPVAVRDTSVPHDIMLEQFDEGRESLHEHANRSNQQGQASFHQDESLNATHQQLLMLNVS